MDTESSSQEVVKQESAINSNELAISQEEQVDENQSESPIDTESSSQEVIKQESTINNNELAISQEEVDENQSINSNDLPNTLELKIIEETENTGTVYLKTVKESKETVPEVKKEKGTIQKKGSSKKEAFEINVETTIRYQGRNIELNSLFSVEEITDGLAKRGGLIPITEKDIIKALEKEHPELDPSIAKIIYIQKKNLLIPHIPGKKNGLNNKQPSAPNESEGVFQLKILRNRLYLCNENNKKQVTIPERLIYDFIKLSRSFSNEFSVEVKGEIYYDLLSNSYKLFIPRQRVTHTLIEVNELTPKEALLFCEMIKVMEIHSHHIYSPIPSKIDNEHDRSRGLYYAIIGDIQNLFPSITVRILNSDSGDYEYLDPIEIISRETIVPSMTPQVVIGEER
ncbi:hypothetical protein CN474_18595 [Bacillus thuringiensis]|nr:hypothetical protein CN474_18595 [Bacillus thuringiensis]